MKNKKQIFSLVLMLLLFIGSEFINVNKVLARQEPTPASSKKPSTPIPSNKPSSGSTGISPKPAPSSQIKPPNPNEESSSEMDEPNFQRDASANRKPKVESVNDKKNNEAEEDWLGFLIKWGLIGLAGLLILGGIGAGIYFLRRNKQREREDIAGGFNRLEKQQRTNGEKIKQLEEVSKNLSQQIAQQKSEISSLKQMSQNASYAAPPPPTISAYQHPTEVPQFPITVDDYLAKVKNGAIPVKYDYKEKILVEDGEKEGGLLVVRDDSTAGNLLYLVPSFGFFQTKGDYTSYFENYYACARPTAGSVWIRQPATVNRVNGGWQLAQQGELEVR